MVKLTVSIDQIAILRNARGGKEPEPVTAAALAELSGADRIAVYLREDRKHILARDVQMLAETVTAPLALRMACGGEVIAIAHQIHAGLCTLVGERPLDFTADGGLDIISHFNRIRQHVLLLKEEGIKVSVCIDPDFAQIDKAITCEVDGIELYTGKYSEAEGMAQKAELKQLFVAAEYVQSQGLEVTAGAGLNYQNITPVVQIPGLHAVTIGHSIIARSVFTGLTQAVKEMKALLTF